MNILVVEDNRPEQIIMQEAFKEAQAIHELHLVKDGIEAIEFMQRKGDFQDAPVPDLIILDLNMPRKNGLEVLSEIKADYKLKHIPVLVFSNSEYAHDICKAYTLGANAYIAKPSDFQGFIDLVHSIDSFWLKQVRYCTH